MEEPVRADPEFLPPAVEALVDEACDQFETACQKAGSAGPLPRIEDYLAGVAGPEREPLARELISLDIHYRRHRGQTPQPEDYRSRFPGLDIQWLASALEASQAPERGPGGLGTGSDPSSPRDPLDELAKEFTARYRRGEQPSVSEYAEKFPDLASRIGALFPALVVMEQARFGAGVTTGPFQSRAGEGNLLPEHLGDYRLLREIGRGGMGVVYEAVQESLGRHVALKILPFHRLMGPAHLERFRREARAAAQLHHTNIVPVFGVGEAEGVHYYAMQFIQGHSLDAALDEVRRLRVCKSGAEAEENGSRAKPGSADTHSELASQTQSQYCRSVAQVGVQVAEALAYAHKQGILHRDIKPSNLLLDTRGMVWINDFGLAKAEGSEDLTHTGDIVGTVRYMAPERFEGQADSCSDVYSIGITLYEMLTLRPAFADADRARLVERVRQEEPPRPRALDPHIPRDLETIVRKAMAKEPANRYPSAGALAEDLRRFLNSEPIQARPVRQLERLWRWSKRKPVIASLAGAVFILSCAVAVVASVGYLQTQQALISLQRLYYAERMGHMQPLWESHNILGLQDLLAETGSYPAHGFEWYYWQRLSHLEHVSLLGHKGGVTAVAFAPDSQRLVTGGNDCTGRIWDATSGQELLCLQGHRSNVTGVAFAPHGRWLVTSSTDGTARLWEATSGRQLRILQDQKACPIWAVAVTHDGMHVVTGNDDGTACVWDTASGEKLLTLKKNPGPVWALAATPDGRRLVTVSQDQGGRTITRLWDVETAQDRLIGHSAEAHSVAISAEGQLILKDEDTHLKLWEAASGQCLGTPLYESMGTIRSVALSADGKRAMAGFWDGTAKLWDTVSRREILTLKGHRNWVVCVAVSPDGQRLATASLDGTARVWDISSGRGTRTFRGHSGPVNSVAVTPDGHRIVTGSKDGTVKIWDLQKEQEPLTLKGHTGAVGAVAVTPNGQQIVTGSGDHTARIWDAQSGHELQKLEGHTGVITSVAVTPDGKCVVTGSADGTARFWDIGSGRELRAWNAGQVYSVAVTPDGERLVTGTADGMVRFWDAASGRELLSFQGHPMNVEFLVPFSDNRRLVTSGLDGTAAVWDTANGRELLRLKGHTGAIRRVALTLESQRIVTGGSDGTARIWDTFSGRELLILKGHNGPVRSVAVTPDGKIISGGEDGTVKIWEAASPEEVTLWAKLNKKAERRRLAWQRPATDAPGFIQTWLVLAPLKLENAETGAIGLAREQLPSETSLQPCAGDSELVTGQAISWQAFQGKEPILDFNRLLDKPCERGVAYAVCYVISAAERHDLLLQVGSDDQSKVYLNGQEIYNYPGLRALLDLDPVGPVKLHKGTNVLVFKVVNEGQAWLGCARFVDTEGNPVQGLRYSLVPEP
jgi:WD40 repeat protein